MDVEKLDKTIKTLSVPSMNRLLQMAYRIIGELELKNFLLEKKIEKLKGDIEDVIKKVV